MTTKSLTLIYALFYYLLANTTGHVSAFTTTVINRGGYVMFRNQQITSPLYSSETDTLTLDGETIRGPITPLRNFVLVKTKDTLAATGGGILLPDSSQERPTEGEVIAAGPGKLHPHTGVRIHNPVTTGMSVLYGKFAGTPMRYNDDDMQMIRDDDVMLYYKGIKMTKDNVTPCRDYVLVKLDKEKLETESGIVVAAAVTKDSLPCVGTVFKVGEGRLCSTGEFTPSPVNVGQRVKFRDYAGNDIKIDGEEYSLVRMVDILCVSKQE
jgi:chaperonin GroES